MTGQAELGFGGLLRQLRDNAGLTQDELAEAARVSQRAVSDLERGINRTARKDTALLLAGALGLEGPARELFIAAARGRRPAGAVMELQPLRSLSDPVLPNNLPAQLATFIGRDREIAEVQALVASSRLVTLTGAGGAGKTRLGLQVAAGLLQGSGDGVWLVELAAVSDQNSVCAAIGDALRIPAQPGRPALDMLSDALAPLDMLIVLDNCEHLIGGCARVAEALLRRCRKLRLIATSREPLGISGEAIYRVPPLSMPADGGAAGADVIMASDALALLAYRAREKGVRLAVDPASIALAVSVCRRLDGMPLAIELAAARLRSMSLADLADRLDQRFRLLTGGSRTVLARQQTLRATVDWSYSQLTAAEQLLLARLAVFAGSFDLTAAEAVCGFGTVEPLEVADLLGSLVDKSLLLAEPAATRTRYRLLETIRLFAAERLAEAGREDAPAVRQAHCLHYLAVAETAAPRLASAEQGIWRGQLDTDHPNTARAIQHAADAPGGTALVLRFAVALWRYWGFSAAREEEAAELLVPVLQRPGAAADPALFAEALFAGAQITNFNDLPTSLKLAELAEEVASRIGDERLVALSCGLLCFDYYFAGEPERARRLGLQSVELARKLGDDVLLGMSLNFYLWTAAPAAAGPLYDEAIACTERTGDLIINEYLHFGAGCVALEMGDVPGARAHLESAIRVAESIGEHHLFASATLGYVQRAEQDPDSARSTFTELVRTSRRVGDKFALAHAVSGLAIIATDLGDWERAAMLHGIEDTLLDRIGIHWAPGDARNRQQSLDQIGAEIGQDRLWRVYDQGAALSFDHAIDLAIGQAPIPPSTP